MLPICKNAPSSWGSPQNVKSPTENWKVGYADSDLCPGDCQTWCQEFADSELQRLMRGGVKAPFSPGYNDISSSGYSEPDLYHMTIGWRPVLELVD